MAAKETGGIAGVSGIGEKSQDREKTVPLTRSTGQKKHSTDKREARSQFTAKYPKRFATLKHNFDHDSSNIRFLSQLYQGIKVEVYKRED